MYKWIAAGLTCFIIAVLYFTTPSPSTEEVQIGSVLREANLLGLSVPDRTLSSYRGKPLIINVWASWCGPCRDEMRSIQELALRYDGKQFNIIGISTDDYREQATSFLKDSGTTFSQYSDDKRLMETMLGANKIPLTILVDADGKVLDKINGSHDWSSPASIDLIRNTFHIEI